MMMPLKVSSKTPWVSLPVRLTSTAFCREIQRALYWFCMVGLRQFLGCNPSCRHQGGASGVPDGYEPTRRTFENCNVQDRTSDATMDPRPGQEFSIGCLSITESIMSDASTHELIDNLRQSVRHWKTLALTLLVGLGLVIVVGTGTIIIQVQRARHEAEAARQAEMEGRQQAERVTQIAEDALREAK